VRDYDLAIQSVAGTLEYVSNEALENNFNEHVILWSSRAIAVGQPEIAEQLLALQGFNPVPEDWRVPTLVAMATCVKGEVASGIEMFKSLEGTAPMQGLHDAKATTAVVLSSIGEDGSALLKDLQGTTGAYAAYKATKMSQAKDLVDTKLFERFLQGGL
jgi:hypothetical protein